jgi:polyhydroxybutyrate depolymerase
MSSLASRAARLPFALFALFAPPAAFAFAALTTVTACSASKSAGYTPPPLVALRPYKYREPAGYDPKTPTPLVIVLHGYGAGGILEQAYLELSALSEAKTFLLAYPDGTPDSKGKLFWNGTDACCNFDHIAVDDVAYIGQVIDDMTAQYNVDPKRIYLVGHSNGAFMSHRFACEVAPRIAAIVTLAGMQWADASKCTPSAPVAVLQVHGDADDVIAYGGGTTQSGTFPSAHQTVATWAQKNGCPGALTATGKTLDLEASLAGEETTVERYDGCGASVELWTIRGGGHIPSWSPAWPEAMWGFLMANPKK